MFKNQIFLSIKNLLNLGEILREKSLAIFDEKLLKLDKGQEKKLYIKKIACNAIF